jgi:hypothetical protein
MSKNSIKKSQQQPLRLRKFRGDASIQSVGETIEKKLGLPSGCIRIVNPSGRRIRADATVDTLWQHWAS